MAGRDYGQDLVDDDEQTAKSAGDILEEGGSTYRERNAIYKDNYKHFGPIMAELFPNGLTLTTPDDWNKMGLFVQCVSKLTRYAAQFEKGHLDSVHDLMVYAAMLQEVTRDAMGVDVSSRIGRAHFAPLQSGKVTP